MAKVSAILIVGVFGAVILGACGPVHVDPDDAGPAGVPDGAPAGSPDGTPGTTPPPGTPDAAPPPAVTHWYKTSDGVEHEGLVPGLVADDGPPDAPALRANYVTVEWCDRSNSNEGTVCRWDNHEACTRAQAWAECDADVAAIGCVIHYPQVLYY